MNERLRMEGNDRDTIYEDEDEGPTEDEEENAALRAAESEDEEGRKKAPEDAKERVAAPNEDESDEVGRKVKSAPVPREPTQAEVDEHELTHVPFRSWCVHCQRGKARRRRHLRRKRTGVRRAGEPGMDIPVISIDYMYMEVDYSRRKNEEEYSKDIEGKSPILVLHDSVSSAIFAHDVGSKGRSGDSIRCVQQDLESLGYANRDIVVKGDQEASIQAVWEEVSKLREGKQSTVPEASPVGESPANGAAENSIFRVQGQIRTMLSDLESKLTRTIKRTNTNRRPWPYR